VQETPRTGEGLLEAVPRKVSSMVWADEFESRWRLVRFVDSRIEVIVKFKFLFCCKIIKLVCVCGVCICECMGLGVVGCEIKYNLL